MQKFKKSQFDWNNAISASQLSLKKRENGRLLRASRQKRSHYLSGHHRALAVPFLVLATKPIFHLGRVSPRARQGKGERGNWGNVKIYSLSWPSFAWPHHLGSRSYLGKEKKEGKWCRETCSHYPRLSQAFSPQWNLTRQISLIFRERSPFLRAGVL